MVRRKRKTLLQCDDEDNCRNRRLDILEDIIDTSEFFTPIHITDDIIGVTPGDRRTRTLTRKKFMQGIGSRQSATAVYKYQTPGRATNWIVAFKIPHRLKAEDPRFVSAVATATGRAPEYLSRRQSHDAITRIRAAISTSSTKLAKSLLDVVLPDNISQNHSSSTQTDYERIAELSDLINCGDYVHDDEDVLLCVDSRVVNKRGNTDSSKFDSFWITMERVIDMDGAGAHVRLHARGGDLESTINVTYAPGINSIPQLIAATVECLKKEGKKEGNDYNVPHRTWVSLQLSPTYENRKIAERHTGRLSIKRKLQSRNARDEHHHGHWVAQKKRIWRYHG